MIKLRAGSILTLVLVGLTLASGCAQQAGGDRPTTYAVTGTVTQGGQGVEGATVSFVPTTGSTAAVGKTDASGKFELTTFASGDGALPGEYQVKIVKFDIQTTEAVDEDSEAYTAPQESETVAPAENQLPEKYADPSSSGLTATVTEDPSSNEFNFELEG